jgi:solute carrier family 25 (mitochondrial phosphate transporter), member 23/24/25/41
MIPLAHAVGLEVRNILGLFLLSAIAKIRAQATTAKLLPPSFLFHQASTSKRHNNKKKKRRSINTTKFIQITPTSPSTAKKPLFSSLSAIQLDISRPMRQLLAGGMAGGLSKTIVAPLERISTLVMTDRKLTVGGAARHAWLDGGLKGLFRGNHATLLKIFPSSAIQFSIFHGIKDKILASRQPISPVGEVRHTNISSSEGELTNVERLVAGAAAGAAAVTVTYPLEACRTFMSVSGGMKGSLIHVASTVIRSQGITAVYRGFKATLIGDMMGSSLGFAAYELANHIYKDRFNNGRTAPPEVRGVLGAMSASVVITMTMPLEVVRRRLQVQGSLGRPILYKGTWDALRTIVREEGVLRGFYAASLPLYLKVVPSIGCMYMIYDWIMTRERSGVMMEVEKKKRVMTR